MSTMYGWASVLAPLIGSCLSVFSQRYAYMNLSLVVMLVLCVMVYITRNK